MPDRRKNAGYIFPSAFIYWFDHIFMRKEGVFMSDFGKAMQEAKKLAETPEGKQLAALLQNIGSTDIQRSMDAAAAGDFRQAQHVLSALMNNPEAKALLEKLGGNHG